MQSERWQQIESLYHLAREWEPRVRAERLAEACGVDADLRCEVEELLAQDARPGEVLDRPVWNSAVSRVRQSGVRPGVMLGPYEIESPIGEGGMGEVWRAHDTKLNRTVAIKILAGELQDRQARLRFQREARTASSLNHPHILTVFDVGEFEGRQYLVTEFVDQGTLREWATSERRSWQQVVELLVGVADGLSAAHDAGILHRDIKPENILVAKNGYAKLADFGLAKRIGVAPSDPAESFQRTVTNTGMIAGTVTYMSPEQASGKPVDARSDIFSFGVVLYEMLTGRAPFSGATLLEQLVTLVQQTPAALPDNVPPSLRLVVARALEKDPTKRYQAMRDLVVDLRRTLRDGPGIWAGGRWAPIVAASVAVALVGVVAARWMMRPPGEPTTRGAASIPKGFTFTQLTDQPGQELDPSLAPDGKSFVYTSRASGNWDIYFQLVGDKNPVNLTKDSDPDDTEPAFSPDGGRIAFHSDRDGGGIFVMSATGEHVRRITAFGHNPAWSPDGSQIVFATTIANPEVRLSSESQLFSVNVATGEKHPITPQTGIAMQPHWSPHGYRVAYWAQVQGRLAVWTIPSDGGEPVRVTDDAAANWNPVWSPDGRSLYFASNRGGSMNLWRVAIDERSGKTSGETEPVTTPSPYAALISFSATGRQLVYVQRIQSGNIHRVRFDPVREIAVGPPEPVTQGSRMASSALPSPDGEWVAFVGGGNLFVTHSDGSGLRQITSGYSERWPGWSPDGKLLAFLSNRGGRFDVWTIRPDGSGLHQVTYTAKGAITHPVWSPDGRRLTYSLQNGPQFVIDADKSWSSQSPEALPPLSEPDTWFEAASWSPDGRKLAGWQMRADGRFSGISIYSFETVSYTRITDFGQQPTWLKDGRRLIFTRGVPQDPAIYLVDSQSRKIQQILSVAPNEVRVAAISADNRWIYFTFQVTEADIWLANLQ
jgi:Tol biopolymer transport system component